jgi:pimeloyl-ACP methyl ester carboxylesterase
MVFLTCALTACGGQTAATPSVSGTEIPARPSPTLEPTPTVVPTVAPEPELAPVFEQASCPMDLPPGAVEGETITCGTVAVPDERSRSNGSTVQLAVAVVHSEGGGTPSSPLFMLAGGPGQSALTSFVQILAAPGMERFWADRDVVLVEQRGTRYSVPFLRCDEMSDLTLDLLGQNLGDDEEEQRKLDALDDCRARLTQSGIDLAAYNSVENAADIVAVADALGYEDIDLYGGSYGSLLAQHVMRDYPGRVRSVVLDAVSPLRHAPNMLSKAHSTDRSVRLLFEQCQADSACNEAFPDLEQVYFDLADRLDEAPATLVVTNPGTGEEHPIILTGDRLVSMTRDLLYVTPILPDLPGAIYDMAGGDFKLLELIQSQLLFNLDLADGLYHSVVCTELADFTVDDMADSDTLYPRVGEVVEDLIDEVMLQPCQVWGVDLLGPEISRSVAGEVPTLLVSGEFDPTVPPSLAEVAAEDLANAYLITIPGLGHTALGRSECATDLMLDFFDDPSQAPDATCVELLAPLAFRVPDVAGVVELEPYTNEELGISGVAPAGWTELRRGVIARGSSGVDQTVLIYDVAPISSDEFFGLVVQQFGLAEAPESTGELESNGLTWAVYEAEVQGYPIDFALAEQGELALVILLLSDAGDHEVLREGVFLPAVEALVPPG